MTPFIDTHCHIGADAFDADRDEVIARMRAAGMAAAVSIACDDADLPKLEVLLRQHPGFLYGAWAIHPEYPDHREADIDEIAEVARRPGMVAVGETGLDFYWCKEPLDWQRKRFCAHIAAARIADRPLIIHARDAEAEALDILKAHHAGDLGFVMHCFCADAQIARGVIDAGGFISFTGNLTFKKNDALRAVAASVPLDRLMIETDAPYMAPVPYRGKRCEPQHAAEVARTIASLKNITLEETLAAVTDNARRFFRLDGF